MRLRRKLTIAFFVVSSLLAAALALFLYRFVERQLQEQYKERVRDVAQVGRFALDIPTYQRLLAKRTGGLDEAAVTDVEQSEDYKRISDQLNAIRATEGKLIHFVYLLAPGATPDTPRFVVDGDVLAMRAKLAKGEQLAAHEDISHFDQVYEVAEVPLLRQALAECSSQLEPGFVYDKDFDLSSVSAYVPLADLSGAPLRDADGTCLGVLGIDISDEKMRDALAEAGGLAFKVSLAVIAIGLLVSIAMGTVLSRSVTALADAVRRFAEKDFGARTQVRTRDEIGQLGSDFNTMADSIQNYSENLEDLVKQRTSELSAEKATSERLLLNVLPAPIAERLKTGENLIVDRFESVTVMFADIAGFTALSSRTSPEALVTMLNELFSLFDTLAEKHGLEKIKTIGDSYMAVAGVPRPIADHATAMAYMALEMQAGVEAYAKRTGSELTIRIGLHTGPVVAGVIGTKKFIYDLWGDTVNTASRMESHGIPGRVQVSEATYKLLVEQFELEARGVIDIKGKGEMNTYLLVRQKVDPQRVSIAVISKN
ncbi:MAG: adenylate/guanylate cyclase domain-containing protein [Kofleriaceae bacterium]|nr:adenylate/guanylate cyclase domain-containing protein [Kofleriaceae bacterium]